MDEIYWQKLEKYFRRTMAEYAELRLRHLTPIHGAGYVERDKGRLVNIGLHAWSAKAFEFYWKKTFEGWNDPDNVEEFKELSIEFDDYRDFVGNSLLYREEYIQSSKGRDFEVKEEIEIFDRQVEKVIDKQLVAPEQAFYGIYLIWKPDSIVIVKDEKKELLKAVSVNPKTLRIISPRLFEELVAYIYETIGCKVMVTKQSGDYGADVLAWHGGTKKDSALTAIQVKRYAKHNKVGLKEIYELHGAVTHYRADKGVVVTTSDFTGPAKRFAAEANIELVNFAKLQEEIERIIK